MDKSLYSYHRLKVAGWLFIAFLFLFLAYLFSGSLFVKTYVHPQENYMESVNEVIQSSAFWFFFVVQLIVYSTVVFVILKSFYNERRMTLMQQEFVNNVTHEIKTPLSTILMAAEVLVEENIHSKPFRRDQYISIIRNEGERLREELDRVLEVARMSNMGNHLNKEVVSVHEQLLIVVDRMKLQLKNYNGVIQVNWNSTADKVLFDKKSLELIFTNILDNALKYNINEPSIEVNSESEGNFLTVTIRDNGIGINPIYLGELFQRFFRVPLGETHHIKGFGLGLYLVKQLMDAHNSSIFVSSIENVGTTITLKIPLELKNNE